jgi:hypothetical protein
VPEALAGCSDGQVAAIGVSGHVQNPGVFREGVRLASISPGLGSTWEFLLRTDLLASWVQRAGEMAWLAALVFPLGFWARRPLPAAVACALVAVNLLLLPYAFHLRSVSGAEAMAMAAAVAAGFVSGNAWRAAPSRNTP